MELLLFPAPLALAAGDRRQVPPKAALPLGVRMPLLKGQVCHRGPFSPVGVGNQSLSPGTNTSATAAG